MIGEQMAYASAHADAAGAGHNAGFATEILELTRVLVELLPNEDEALALAALVRYAEARRPARLDDTARWRRFRSRIPRSGAGLSSSRLKNTSGASRILGLPDPERSKRRSTVPGARVAPSWIRCPGELY